MKDQEYSSPKRCPWALHAPLERVYHDTEWGVPCFDDTRLFEFLTLEGAQAGLSWLTILQKRQGYRDAFANFNVHTVADFSEDDLDKLLNNPAIVRNKLKIRSTVNNAKAFLKAQEKYESFSQYIWAFTDGKPLINHWENAQEVPAQTALSNAIAKDLKKHGFSFVGSTTIYAFMQAVGMVNDHLISCFRHSEVQQKVTCPPSAV